MTSCTDPGCRWLAAQFLRKQGKQLLAQLPGIRAATDPECVHHARVASRRFRAGLQLFGDSLPRDEGARWDKQIRRVTRGLGAARDLDVQRDYLVDELARLNSAAEYPGIAQLLVQTEQERARAQRTVLKALKRLEKSNVLRAMRKTLKPAPDASDDLPRQSPACVQMAQQHIGERLEEVLSFEDSLEDAEDCRQHHALRIAAKRLRYTLEICRPVFGSPMDSVLETVKHLQSLLGEIHDCDVWIERLPKMLEDERRWIVKCYGHAGPLERYRPGFEALGLRQRQRRQERFAELQRFWQGPLQSETWPRLWQLLEAPNVPAAEPQGDVAFGAREEAC